MKEFVRIFFHWNVSVVLSPTCINVFSPSTFFLISSSAFERLIRNTYVSSLVRKVNQFGSSQHCFLHVFFDRREERVFVCRTFLLPIVPDLIDESVMQKNSGAEAASESHMVAPIPQCTLLCITPLRASSNSVKLFMSKTLITSVSSGEFPLNFRIKQSGPGLALSGLTRLQAPFLKGASNTYF